MKKLSEGIVCMMFWDGRLFEEESTHYRTEAFEDPSGAGTDDPINEISHD